MWFVCGGRQRSQLPEPPQLGALQAGPSLAGHFLFLLNNYKLVGCVTEIKHNWTLLLGWKLDSGISWELQRRRANGCCSR